MLVYVEIAIALSEPKHFVQQWIDKIRISLVMIELAHNHSPSLRGVSSTMWFGYAILWELNNQIMIHKFIYCWLTHKDPIQISMNAWVLVIKLIIIAYECTSIEHAKFVKLITTSNHVKNTTFISHFVPHWVNGRYTCCATIPSHPSPHA